MDESLCLWIIRRSFLCLAIVTAIKNMCSTQRKTRQQEVAGNMSGSCLYNVWPSPKLVGEEAKHVGRKGRVQKGECVAPLGAITV